MFQFHSSPPQLEKYSSLNYLWLEEVHELVPECIPVHDPVGEKEKVHYCNYIDN
jgi:hypothetical protein